MLQIHQFVFNNFEENTYIAVDKATGIAAIIDPGMLYDEEKSAIEKYITEHDIKLNQIILTHAHLDHCFGAEYVKSRFGVPVKAHEADAALAAGFAQQGARFGMGKVLKNGIEFDVTLHDGDIIDIGESKLDVIHVPGHSKGGIVLYDKADGVAFVGDSIFAGSIGRTDLEGGDHATLINALKTKVLTLPDNTYLLPGHGEVTTVRNEREHNPYLR